MFSEKSELSLGMEVSKKSYVEDVDYSMRYTRWFLSLLGIWPDVSSSSTRFEKLASKILVPVPSLVITSIIIPIVSLMIVRDLAPRQFILLLAPLSFRVSNVIKNVILVSRRRTIKLCIEHMETDWRRIENDQDHETMIGHLQVGRNLTTVCIFCWSFAFLFYNCLPFVVPKKTNELNQTIRPITIPGIDIYVDLRAGYNYEVVTFVSLVSSFFSSTIAIAICNLGAVLVCHACGQIQIVMSRLENLVDKPTDHSDDRTNLIRKRISFIIRIHVRVLRFASKINDFLQQLCFTEVVDATLIICLVAYIVITEEKGTSIMTLISYSILLGSLSFNLFMFCQFGQLLKEKCEDVGNAAYMTEWYRLPGKLGLTIIMFITMARYPRRLTAGRVVELSMTTFGAIMKTSFGYSNMLRTMAA